MDSFTETIDVTRPKRRYRNHGDIVVNKNYEKQQLRKKAIRTSEAFKPLRRRAICKDRMRKYDDRRGEEDIIDMEEEEFNNVLSGRKAEPFTITHTYHTPSEYATVVAHGTLYAGNTSDEDITITHEVWGWRSRGIIHGDFRTAQYDLLENIGKYPGRYDITFA